MTDDVGAYRAPKALRVTLAAAERRARLALRHDVEARRRREAEDRRRAAELRAEIESAAVLSASDLT